MSHFIGTKKRMPTHGILFFVPNIPVKIFYFCVHIKILLTNYVFAYIMLHGEMALLNRSVIVEDDVLLLGC